MATSLRVACAARRRLRVSDAKRWFAICCITCLSARCVDRCRCLPADVIVLKPFLPRDDGGRAFSSAVSSFCYRPAWLRQGLRWCRWQWLYLAKWRVFVLTATDAASGRVCSEGFRSCCTFSAAGNMVGAYGVVEVRLFRRAIGRTGVPLGIPQSFACVVRRPCVGGDDEACAGIGW